MQLKFTLILKKENNILTKNDIRITPIREKVIDYFIQSEDALSHQDIEIHLANTFDRVTIYRTLNHFEEKGIIHKVIDSSGVGKYALCHNSNCSHQHEDNHLHFKCTHCEKLECLYEVAIPKIILPSNYSSEKTYLLVEGICNKCSI